MGIKWQFNKSGNAILTMPAGNQEIGGTYKLDGDKIFFSPGDKSGTIVLTLHEGAVSFSTPSFVTFSSMATLRCTKAMSAGSLSEDDAKATVSSRFNPTVRLALGTLAVTPEAWSGAPRSEDAPVRINTKAESYYEDWAKVGVVQVSPGKSVFCSARSNRDVCSQLTEIKVTAGPQGSAYTVSDGSAVEIPVGDRSNLRITNLKPLDGLSEKRYLVEFEWDAKRSPLLLKAAQLHDSNATEQQAFKGRDVVHWDAKYSDWEVLSGDVAQKNKDYTTSYAEKASK